MYITVQRLASLPSMFQIKSSEDWKNPPAVVRIALVASVFATLGTATGLYVNLLSWFRYEPLTAELVGATIGAVFGAWFEHDAGDAGAPPLVNSAVQDEGVPPPLEYESVI